MSTKGISKGESRILQNRSDFLNNVSNATTNSTKIPCKNNTDCNYGNCNNQTFTCDCNKGFIHVYNNNLTFPCNYEQLSQYNAFIYELLIGFGSGQFYIKRYFHGVIKLFAYLFGICMICLFPLTLQKAKKISVKGCPALTISLFYCMLAVGFAVFYIYDLVMIKNNQYKDGNGIALKSWKEETR